MSILREVLNVMPDYFTSNEFSRQAKVNGLTQRAINNGVIAAFLHKNAIQCETNRSWRKRKKIEKNINSSNKIDEAIKLLKSNGYKVLKEVSDWREL